MRKILIILSLLVPAGALLAAPAANGVEAADIRMNHTGEYLNVTFTFNAGKRVTRPDYDLVVTPVIRGGAGERKLTPIVVHGRRAKGFDEECTQQRSLYTTPGGSLEYTASLPYEAWMRGADLVLDGVSVGCCDAQQVQMGRIAEGILLAEPSYEIKLVQTPVPVSTGQQLEKQYAFIAPIAELDRIQSGTGQGSESDRIIAGAREGSISVFFAQGSRRIDRNFNDNHKNLVEMVSAVRTLAAARDSRIARIVVAGFASPEGSIELNDRLAHERAAAVKEFLTDNTNVDPEVVQLYNGSVDWTGLRDLVARSDLYRKQQILRIIDQTQPERRLSELMRLDGGEPYREMLSKFFPKLRQAAYIKVYYERK